MYNYYQAPVIIHILCSGNVTSDLYSDDEADWDEVVVEDDGCENGLEEFQEPLSAILYIHIHIHTR